MAHGGIEKPCFEWLVVVRDFGFVERGADFFERAGVEAAPQKNGRAEFVAGRAISWGVERFDEIHVAIGAVRESEAIFRFAFWTEHKNKEEGRQGAPLGDSPNFDFRDASVRDASRRGHLIANWRHWLPDCEKRPGLLHPYRKQQQQPLPGSAF